MTNPTLGHRAQTLLRAVPNSDLPPVNVLDLFDQPAPPPSDYLVFGEVRSSGDRILACVSTLATIAADYPATQMSIEAMSHERDTFVITYAVNFGPADQVAYYGEQPTAAYELLAAVSKTAFEYFPGCASRPVLDPADNSVGALRTIIEALTFRNEHGGIAPALHAPAAV